MRNNNQLEGLICIILGVIFLLMAYKVLLALSCTLIGLWLINRGLALRHQPTLTGRVTRWWTRQWF